MMTPNMINIPRDEVAEMVKDYAILARSQPDTEEGSALARKYQVKSNRLRDVLDAHPANQAWPKLDKPAKVGGGRFQAGVSTQLVVEAAQRLYEYEVTPEKEAERIARCSAFVANLHRQDGAQDLVPDLGPNLVPVSSPADDQGRPAYKPAKEMRAADWAASLPSSGLSASDLLAIQKSQPPIPSGDLAFGRLNELETFERRYKLLHGAVAGDKLTISIDHGDYTQYIDSGAELDCSLDDPKSVLRGDQP